LRDALRVQAAHNITGGQWLETIRGRRLDAFLVHVDGRKQWREVEGSTREFRTSNASLDSALSALPHRANPLHDMA
jgi:hypothetical protein